MMKEEVGFAWEDEKCYRCRPALYEAMVAGEELVDIDGTRLFFYRLEGMAFQHSIEVLSKEEQFCAKLRAASQDYLAVFGMYRVVSVSTKERKVVDTVEIPSMIEKVEASQGYAAVLTSDEEGENKLVYCWKLDAQGHFSEKYEPVEVHLPEYEECDEGLL